MSMQDEIWKDVIGWNGKYQVSNHGRFKSHNGKFTKLHPNGFITLGTIGDVGYRSVTLRDHGKYLQTRLHTIVGEHFLDKPKSDQKLCINHKDGNKLNNYFENLEWVTLGDNVRHAVLTGLMNLKGERHPHVKLTEAKVIEMRKVRKEGWTFQKIGDHFGVERRQASDVVRGVNWGWLKEGLPL